MLAIFHGSAADAPMLQVVSNHQSLNTVGIKDVQVNNFHTHHESDTPERGFKRKAAAAAMKSQGERMRRNTKARTDKDGPLAVGTVVLLLVHDSDRGKCDPKRIPGIVMHVTEHNNYHVACKGGLLNNCLSRGDLVVEKHKTAASYDLQDLVNQAWNTMKKISMRQAAANYSPVGGQGMLRCDCKTKCVDGRCKCRKAGYICNSRCHKCNQHCENTQK